MDTYCCGGQTWPLKSYGPFYNPHGVVVTTCRNPRTQPQRVVVNTSTNRRPQPFLLWGLWHIITSKSVRHNPYLLIWVSEYCLKTKLQVNTRSTYRLCVWSDICDENVWIYSLLWVICIHMSTTLIAVITGVIYEHNPTAPQPNVGCDTHNSRRAETQPRGLWWGL